MNQTDLPDLMIMVVDDNSHYVRLMERILQVNSYDNILSLTDPMKVVDTYKRSQPDLLLMDIEMSRINGFEILKMLQDEKQAGRLPVILFTENTDPDQKVKALELGAQDVIAKPFSHKEVMTSINRFFERYQQHKQTDTPNEKYGLG
jgi:two-component system KDP operon response regulator KdpE